MPNYYDVIQRLNLLILPRTPLNPKMAYTTLKGVWRRAKRDLLGIDYPADARSVNIINHELQLLVCAIPKVASTTFIRELVYRRALGERVTWHSRFLGDLLAQHEAWRTYYKVAFVRNPWARVVSVYNSHVCSPTPFHVRSLFIRYPGLRHRMPFEEFADWLCHSPDGRDEVADRHWISQHRFLYSGDLLLVDRFARLEALDDELRQICEKVGAVPPQLENHSLKTTAGGASYRPYYSDRTAEAVMRRYAKDIALLDYTF